MALSGTSELKLTIADVRASGAESVRSDIIRSYPWSFSEGSGAGIAVADRKWSSLARSLGPSAGEDIDLAGVLTDAFGVVLTFARVKGIYVFPTVGNLNKINVSRPASLGVTPFLAAADALAVGAGGKFVWEDPAGVVVGAGASDILRIDNAAGTNTVTYDIYVIGTSA